MNASSSRRLRALWALPLLLLALAGLLGAAPARAQSVSFVAQPTSTVSGQPINGTASPAGVTVFVSIGSGMPDVGDTVTVSLNDPNGTGAALGGTNPDGSPVTGGTATGVTDNGGSVTFSGLTVNLSGTYTLTATESNGEVSINSNSFTVTPSLSLAFGQQPTNTVSQQTISPPVTVTVTSLSASQAAGQSVSLSFNTISGGWQTLNGTTTQTAVANSDGTATATFNDLSLPMAGTYTLTASVTDNASNVATATSSQFQITPGAPATLTFTQQPGSPGMCDPTSIALGLPLDSGTANPGVQVEVQDAAGNAIPGQAISIVLTGQTGTLTGTTPETSNAGGIATFLDLRAQPLGTYSLEATVGGTIHAFSNMFHVVPAPVPNNVVTSAADDGGFGTLRSVLSYLPAVKTVTFQPSLFDGSSGGSYQTITLLGGEIDVTQSVSVTAPPDGVAVSGNGQSRVFGVLGGTVSLSNLNVQSGLAPNDGTPFAGDGGGIYNDASLTLTNCRIGSGEIFIIGAVGPQGIGPQGPGGNSAAGDGGGIFNDIDGTLTLTGNTFVGGNTADIGGGIANLGTLSVQTAGFFTGFFNNTAGSAGGGIANAGALTMTGGSFLGGLIGNGAANGGGVYNAAGTATLAAQTLSANDASDGGGVYGAGGTLTLTGCAVTANGASDGGGVYNAGGALTLTSCTFTANSAGANSGGPIIGGAAKAHVAGSGLGGGLFTTGGAATLTDDIFYGDTVSGGVSEIAGPVTATFCDVQQASGVFPGAGNVDADPLFTGGSPFGPSVQIQPNSPVIGRGTAGAPAFRRTDLFGLPFFSPPAIGALEGPEDTHVLWTNPDGRTIFWDTNPQGAEIVAANYDPLTDPSGNTGYVAKAVSTGPDGVSHVLWSTPDGHVALWDVQPDGSHVDSYYGPFADDGTSATVWQPVAVSTGGNGETHILWDNPNGRTILWNVATSDQTGNTGTDPFSVAGNYDGFSDDGTPATVWKAVALGSGPNSLIHILWNNADGNTLLWNLDGTADQPANSGSPTSASTSQNDTSTASTYLLQSDDGTASTIWKARAISVGPDSLPRILWNNPDGRTILWNVASDGSFTITGNYDPLLDPSGQGGFTAVALATGSDSRSHLAWDNPNGETFLWNLLNDGGPNGSGGNDTVTPFFYGIFSDDGTANTYWKAVAISAATQQVFLGP